MKYQLMAIFVKVFVEVFVRISFIIRFDKLFADTFPVHRKSGSIAFIKALLHRSTRVVGRGILQMEDIIDGLFLFFILCFQFFDNFVPIFGLFLNDNRFLFRFLHFITNEMINTFVVITSVVNHCFEL